nr:helix-turn-helix domain-containing protein [Maribellus maritimus]
MVEDLNISRHKLSQVINRSQNKNFYKLMNEYRIREVKEKLENKEYKNLTVLGIAFECGFNSKTTFNRIFKEETGMTPTNYIKGT